MNHSRLCLECGRELFGRTDKKFCTDSCRSAYNNKTLPGVNNYHRKINRILKRNRNILESLNPDGKIKMHQEKLLKEGFDFDFFTNVYITKEQRQYRFCYEQGYLVLDDGYVLLVKREV